MYIVKYEGESRYLYYKYLWKKYNDDSNNDFVICNIKKVKMRLEAVVGVY